MFQALTALYDLKEAVNESKALFATLAAVNDELAAAIPAAVAADDIVSEATTLNSSISQGIANHSFANSEVEGLIEDIGLRQWQRPCMERKCSGEHHFQEC